MKRLGNRSDKISLRSRRKWGGKRKGRKEEKRGVLGRGFPPFSLSLPFRFSPSPSLPFCACYVGYEKIKNFCWQGRNRELSEAFKKIIAKKNIERLRLEIQYCQTPLNRHPLNMDTSLLRTVLSVPATLHFP